MGKCQNGKLLVAHNEVRTFQLEEEDDDDKGAGCSGNILD